MLDAASQALASFADPSMLLFLGIGVLVGLIVGVLPGLGGTGAVAVLLPFVFVLEPNQAVAMIIGAVAVVHTSDVITSVVLGIPGSASAAVFLLDGHEMAKEGKGGRALSASFISSTIGGLIGIVALTLVVPVARPVVTAFGSPEIFMLILLGIFLTALLSKGNMVKGLLIAVFGLALGMIGISPVSAEYRYTFGSEFLMEGVGLVAVALGIFGVAEIIHLVAHRAAVSDQSISLGGGWAQGARDVLRYKGDVLRGSAVGVGTGILPGVGATAGAWLAYGQAQAIGGRKPGARFGKGDPRGVIAPSASSNGIESGALIPTLLFGVPGAAPFALLLGVLLIFGIQPGPELIEQELDLVYFIVWSFAIASLVGAVLAFFMARPLTKLSFIRFPVLAAALVPLLFMSGFQEPLNLNVFYVMLLLGGVGWVCKITSIPRAPFLIAYVLAIPLERYYFITVSAFDPGEWMTRPFVVAVAALLIIAVGWTLYKRFRARSVRYAELNKDVTVDDVESLKVPPFVGVATSGLMLLFFLVGLIMAFDFSETGRLFPFIVGGAGVLLGLLSLVGDLREVRSAGGLGRVEGEFRQQVKVVAISALWLLGFIWAVFAIGMYAGTAVFCVIFLLVVAQMKPLATLVYTVAIVGTLYMLASFAELVPPVGWLF
ncbi:tripartite tricarboxylate transporter permease [Nesterenkonia aerolata]|uniref:Tripartite tricarboxylate transporter permease n=1 Tax=Nesterenkonia aerolata TaxID=3074079 RepID=A0ABU2DRS1_9MICC|nr:tripartite tricarboxylate transporter permease [Nesterenkonia sp. LY-0111]MDR8019116.1 tripartite tricarboxylate transporter permease [Nesterenkonia sp. LY-0111]